jgi:hypothetical protein
MKKATQRNMWNVMFMHVVSAELNLLNGVLADCGSDVDEIAQLITDGKEWLAENQDKQPVRASVDAWTSDAELIKNTLDAFNNGELSLACAPHND